MVFYFVLDELLLLSPSSRLFLDSLKTHAFHCLYVIPIWQVPPIQREKDLQRYL